MPTTVEILPQITYARRFVAMAGLLANTKPHPDYPLYRVILPRIVNVSPGAENIDSPPEMKAWLEKRMDPAQFASHGKLLDDPDGDGTTNFEEYAMGLRPGVDDGDPLIVSNYLETQQFGLQVFRNLFDTGIKTEVCIGDGVNMVPANVGADIKAMALYPGGPTEGISDDIADGGTYFAGVRVWQNQHTWVADPSKCLVRVRLSWTF